MAGKEGPLKNFGAVGRGGAPAEKVKAAPTEKVESDGVEFKVGVVPSAFMPCMSRPCSGGHDATEEQEQEQEEADLVSGVLRACSARRSLGKKEMGPLDNEMEESVTGWKRKAEGTDGPAEHGEGVVAAAADEVVPGAGECFVDDVTGIKYVDMPENYLCCILSQKRMDPPPYDPRECKMMSEEEIERELASIQMLKESQEGVNDEFFEFQAWVRETYETKGRVLVPEESIPPEFLSEE